MNTKLAFRLARAAGAAFAIALLIGGAAKAVTDTVFKYSTPKNGWYTVHPMAFTPNSNTTAANSYLISATGLAAGAFGCFTTSVNLPHGAKITSLAVWYRSNTSQGVGAELFRATVAGPATGVMTTLQSTDTSSAYTAMTGAPSAITSTVNNQKYSYGLRVCLSGSFNTFHAARINYTYANAGD